MTHLCSPRDFKDTSGSHTPDSDSVASAGDLSQDRVEGPEGADPFCSETSCLEPFGKELDGQKGLLWKAPHAEAAPGAGEQTACPPILCGAVTSGRI